MMLHRLLLALALFLAPVAAIAQGVSAADPRAARAGVEILREGGTAADAAFATMLALTVVEPQSSGIGGGGFLVYHDQASGRLSSFNGRETAPHAATPSYFLGPDGRPRDHRDVVAGGMSVGVPGNVRLMELAHERHGRLAWARLFRPAIRLARDGFEISPRLYRALASPGSLAGFSPGGRALFYQADGTPKAAGTLVRNPARAGSGQCDVMAPDRRIDAARLRRPRRLSGRCRFRARAGRRADGPGLSRGPFPTHLARARDRPRHRGHTPRRRRPRSGAGA